MKVDMPNEKEIKVEIDNIIAQGIGERESFHSYLKNMYRQIGIRYLFRDGLEIIFTILLVSSILLLTIKDSNIYYMENMKDIYVYLFIISPILYLSMSILNFINTKQNKTYEIEMTCKYNIYQISAFRMLVFSMICIVFNFSSIYIVSYFYEDINYLKAFIISIAGLFLFSTIFLFTLIRIKNRFIKYFTVLGWIVFNLVLYIFKVDFYIQLLNSISTYTWFVVAIGSILAYIKNLRTLIIFRNKEGMI
ncbi:hypothetical protein [Clostridiisalibacter paucivorans]|uniref:hypothetical protein n=1 Tax=Clostridiisalibacter paucivorans TaxID=408753 RepID=UPI0005572D84|nr:hypothetical protein [Clostridiisalibacter paucivorans]